MLRIADGDECTMLHRKVQSATRSAAHACEQRDREYGLTSPGERGEIPIGLDDPSEPPPMRAEEDAPTE